MKRLLLIILTLTTCCTIQALDIKDSDTKKPVTFTAVDKEITVPCVDGFSFEPKLCSEAADRCELVQTKPSRGSSSNLKSLDSITITVIKANIPDESLEMTNNMLNAGIKMQVESGFLREGTIQTIKEDPTCKLKNIKLVSEDLTNINNLTVYNLSFSGTVEGKPVVMSLTTITSIINNYITMIMFEGAADAMEAIQLTTNFAEEYRKANM